MLLSLLHRGWEMSHQGWVTGMNPQGRVPGHGPRYEQLLVVLGQGQWLG